YVTINDIVLNAGSEHEHRRPFEIFINSKNMDHFQWIVALTRIMSAVFRKGGDVTFLVEEMKAVFDPRGGYFKAGGVYMPSLVAELGSIVEEHRKTIGLIQDPELSPEQRALTEEKRAAYAALDSKKNTDEPVAPRDELSGDLFPEPRVREEPRSEDVAVTGDGGASFPPSATMCHKCSAKAVVIMDGCATCLNCGYSKCGRVPGSHGRAEGLRPRIQAPGKAAVVEGAAHPHAPGSSHHGRPSLPRHTPAGARPDRPAARPDPRWHPRQLGRHLGAAGEHRQRHQVTPRGRGQGAVPDPGPLGRFDRHGSRRALPAGDE